MAAGEETAALRRQLAAARPDAFTPDMASALNNLASYLSALGRWEEALAAGEKAAALYHRLAAARPDAFTPDLASALNNLANRFSALGRARRRWRPLRRLRRFTAGLLPRAPTLSRPIWRVR